MKYHNDGGLKFLINHAKSFFSVRRVKKTSLVVICSILVFWFIWKLAFQRKAVTSAVGCKSRLAEVGHIYIRCHLLYRHSAQDFLRFKSGQIEVNSEYIAFIQEEALSYVWSVLCRLTCFMWQLTIKVNLTFWCQYHPSSIYGLNLQQGNKPFLHLEMMSSHSKMNTSREYI